MFRDRVYETSTSTGTGNFTLSGAVTGYRTFSSAFTSGNAYYAIVNKNVPTEWEIGSYSVSGTTLARVAGNVLSSSSGASTLVNFSAGTKDVYNIIPASAMAAVDANAILSTVRTTVYQENRINNCAGLIANGNCQSNNQWDMPNGDWWSWGLGLSYANPSGFDGAGGWTTTNQGLSQVNVRINGSYSLFQQQVGFDVQRRNWQNCNCGPTNCYSNCNCNCNCNCACNACGSRC
jgi:hypothetical protein